MEKEKKVIGKDFTVNATNFNSIAIANKELEAFVSWGMKRFVEHRFFSSAKNDAQKRALLEKVWKQARELEGLPIEKPAKK